jgi:hypothetical protein
MIADSELSSLSIDPPDLSAATSEKTDHHDGLDNDDIRRSLEDEQIERYWSDFRRVLSFFQSTDVAHLRP